MSSISAIRPTHKAWLAIAAKTIVVLQSLAVVYLLTSIWAMVAIAVAFAIIVAVVRALSRAAHQVDTIFDEELSS